ncbi:hypothetical protein O181_054671 [Austropuccinia psidii MF-1]|uniref:Uncharacterized protein n=1 Tax=Austropuccinia psidii MF-1 TaxID=1389203 RepID=A0A9Q3E9W2_9BASI|nr:hypothetical protein [Austropuccinia psidii MF-1]
MYLWSKKYGPFGKEFPVSEAPTPDDTSGYSNGRGMWNGVPMVDHSTGGRLIYSSSGVHISRINNQGVVKKVRRITDSPTSSDAEGSDKVDCGEVEVVNHSIDHHSRTSNYKPSSKIFQSQVKHVTPRNFQPVLSTIPFSIPPPSPNPSTSRPNLASPMRLSPIPQPRK